MVKKTLRSLLIEKMVYKNNFTENQIDDMLHYLLSIESNFKFCTNANVLEIGPFNGFHTEIIDFYEPNLLTLIEPNDEAASELQERFPNYKIIVEDIFVYLCDKIYEKKKFDVVICCGLLYHLHSPVFLLELIANQCDPEYVILESMDEKTDETIIPFYFADEEINKPGNFFTTTPFNKSAGLILSAQLPFFEMIMKRLGYDILIQTKGYDHGWKTRSKELVSMTVFKRK